MATMQESSEGYQGVGGEFPCSEGGFPTVSPSQLVNAMWIGCYDSILAIYVVYLSG